MDTKRSRHPLLIRLLSISISSILILSLALTFTFANPASQAYGVTSAQKEAELDEALARLDVLQTELNQLAIDYDAAVLAHAEAENNMLDAQARENAARARIAELQDQLGTRAAGMYRNGQGNYLDVLFGAQTFSDFVSAIDLINRVNAQDAELVVETKMVRAEAEAARIEFTEQEKIAREKQEQIEALKREKEETALSLQAEIANLEKEMLELRLQEELAAEAAKKMAANLGVAALGEVSDSDIARVWAINPQYPFSSTQSISSGFGYRSFDGAFHRGIDFAAPGGTPILAIAGGTVYSAGYNGSMGNCVMITHGNGVFSTYMHASSLNVSAGQSVGSGEVIAYVGTTGNSTGNHLHLEITIGGPSYGGGNWVNPMLFY